MDKIFYEISLEELCAKVILEKNRLLEEIQAPDVAGSSSDAAKIARSAALLNGEGLVADGGKRHLEIVDALLQRRLEEETLEMYPVFDGRNDEEEGAIGTVREERLLTVDGVKVDRCLRRMDMLCQMQRILCARVEAERVINRRACF
ncbi:hypothetical protein ACEWPL_014615 [Roseovarius sp. S1116L3]|uniref:hypothetical protein n=1 Tax=Roseovarius roseus TaxID=3342636 RepID=UPI00372C5B50